MKKRPSVLQTSTCVRAYHFLVSAHRTLAAHDGLCTGGPERGLKVIIAVAGGRSPAGYGSRTDAPASDRRADFQRAASTDSDALLSIAQMPRGVPGIRRHRNATKCGLLAVRLLQ